MLIPRYRTEANTVNATIRNTVQTSITEAELYVCYLDLFQTRNLYFTSSALATYDNTENPLYGRLQQAQHNLLAQRLMV